MTYMIHFAFKEVKIDLKGCKIDFGYMYI